MPNGCCCVYGCSNRMGHSFPKEKFRRKAWIAAVRRESFKPTVNSIVCRAHFLESDYHVSEYIQHGTQRQRRFLKTTAVPSVFTWMKSMTTAQLSRGERQKKRKEEEVHSAVKSWAATKIKEQTEAETNYVYADAHFHVAAMEEIVTTAEEPQIVVEDTSGAAQTHSAGCSSTSFLFPVAIVHDGNIQQLLPQDANATDTATAASVPEPYLSVNAIKTSSKLVHFYTGLENFDVFMTAFWSLGSNVSHLQYAYSQRCDCLSLENQFLLMVVKLRRHYPDFELARMFGVSDFTVQNVFVTWINFCYLQWGEINWWPARGLVHYYCPTDFKRKFPSTRVVVDATEVKVKQPLSNPRAQRASFSSCKRSNTVKVLIGVTPGGLTSYVSEAYGGSTSDRQIVERSPLIHLCERGDSIMANKGFDVQDIFAPRDVQINVPAFFKKENRLAPSTLHNDRKISRKRVHVERIIGMAKVFTICQHRLSILETKLATRIISVCFFLCNFRKTVVSRFA